MPAEKGRVRAQAIYTAALGILLAGFLGGLSVAGIAGAQASKTARIGILWGREALPEQLQALEDGLRDLGWIKGGNLTVEYRFAEGELDRLPSLAADLVSRKVDLIIAVAGPETSAARRATTTIPIVCVAHGDPVGNGDVASLAHPGGNVTGLTSMTPNAATKQLELLKQAVPRAARVAVIWNAANTTKAVDWREVSAIAPRIGIALQSREVRRPADFEQAFAATRRERPDALLTLVDPLTIANRGVIVAFAAKERVPAIYPLRLFVDSGGLMSYGADLTELFRQAPRYIDRILRGARPADLPVAQPTKFETAVNMKTARALGFVLPPSVQLRVDHVIE